MRMCARYASTAPKLRVSINLSDWSASRNTVLRLNPHIATSRHGSTAVLPQELAAKFSWERFSATTPSQGTKAIRPTTVAATYPNPHITTDDSLNRCCCRNCAAMKTTWASITRKNKVCVYNPNTTVAQYSTHAVPVCSFDARHIAIDESKIDTVHRLYSRASCAYRTWNGERATRAVASCATSRRSNSSEQSQ